MPEDVQKLINAWSIDFYRGVSMMDLVNTVVILTVLAWIIGYLYGLAQKK